MIDGNVIRKKRVALHLSQRKLAANITTQATISQIENDNVAPNSDVIGKILRRLGLTMEDVFIEDIPTPGPYLQEADAALKRFDRQGVLDILGKIEINSTFTDEDILHYNFLKTDATMWITKDFSQAIFDYNRMQDLARNKELSIYTVLAICQLGTAYYYNKKEESAVYYFNQLPDLLKQIDVKDNLYWVLFIMDNLTNFWSKKYELEKSIKFGKAALKITEDYHTVSFADTLSFTIGENYGHLNGWDNDKTREYLVQSYFLAKYTGSQIVQDIIEKTLNEHKIGLQWPK